MKMTGVQVPASLLLDRALPATAKIVWMACRSLPDSRPVPIVALQRITGLSRPTLCKGLDQLAAAGWGPDPAPGAPDPVPGAPDPGPTIPIDLLAEHGVGPRAKLLYCLLQLTPGFHRGSGQFRYTGLAELMGVSLNTVKEAARDLAEHGWLQTVQQNQLAPIRFRLSDPHADRAEAEVSMARLRLEDAEFRGEALMREYLSLLIDSDHFQDGVRPGFLKNPETGELMEFDRFYPPAVAFEFNGPQHFGPTERFSGQKAARQQARDLMKRGICQAEGISLIVVTADDLSLEALRQKIGTLLPLRDLTRHGPLVKYLGECSRRYRRAADRWRRPARRG